MTVESGDSASDVAILEAKVNALLPSKYQFCFDSIRPGSMGSAKLKFDADSKVAWGEIWTTYCDLALAGGPPHRGSLLEPPLHQEVEEEPAGYQLVVEEICRGIQLTTNLPVVGTPQPGWIAVRCHDSTMAGWLLRAIIAENIVVRQRHDTLLLPAGPRFRLAKEIKNVIVALAKTCHYWNDHLSATAKANAASFLGSATATSPLLEPPARDEILAREEEYKEVADQMSQAIESLIELPVSRRSPGWVGVQFGDEMTAAWFTRAAIAENILARREAEVLFLPVAEPQPREVAFAAVERLARLLRVWKIIQASRT